MINDAAKEATPHLPDGACGVMLTGLRWIRGSVLKGSIYYMTSLRHAWPYLLGLLLISASAAWAQDEPPPTAATPDSEQVDILLFEGQLALEEGRIPEAVRTFSEIVRTAPDLVDGHL